MFENAEGAMIGLVVFERFEVAGHDDHDQKNHDAGFSINSGAVECLSQSEYEQYYFFDI